MDIPIIYEEKNILVINKPSGLMVHGDGKNNKETLVDWIIKNRPEIQNVGEDIILSSHGGISTDVSISGEVINRPGIVHRLDKETSGVLLITKTQKAFLYFKKQFQEHLIKKTYRALVYGELKKDEGEITLSIGRSRGDFRKRTTDKKYIRGNIRDAYTKYKVLSKNNGYSYLEVYPLTGRTHQIRVHLKAKGYLVLCDSLYAPKRECPEKLGRLGLHAFAIEFKDMEGKNLLLEAPLPDSFSSMIKELFPKLRE